MLDGFIHRQLRTPVYLFSFNALEQRSFIFYAIWNAITIRSWTDSSLPHRWAYPLAHWTEPRQSQMYSFCKVTEGPRISSSCVKVDSIRTRDSSTLDPVSVGLKDPTWGALQPRQLSEFDVVPYSIRYQHPCSRSSVRACRTNIRVQEVRIIEN